MRGLRRPQPKDNFEGSFPSFFRVANSSGSRSLHAGHHKSQRFPSNPSQMNRKLDWCPTFAQAYVGRKRRATGEAQRTLLLKIPLAPPQPSPLSSRTYPNLQPTEATTPSASAPVVLKIVGWIHERDKDLSKAADQENISLVSSVVRRVDDGLMSALPGDHGNRESRTQHPKICEVIPV
jgi:hypothetical protein